jgi:hypothetical protein
VTVEGGARYAAEASAMRTKAAARTGLASAAVNVRAASMVTTVAPKDELYVAPVTTASTTTPLPRLRAPWTRALTSSIAASKEDHVGKALPPGLAMSAPRAMTRACPLGRATGMVMVA